MNSLSAPCPLCGASSHLFWETLRMDAIASPARAYYCSTDRIAFLHPSSDHNGSFPADAIRIDYYGGDIERFHLIREDDARTWISWLKGGSTGRAGTPPTGPDLLTGKTVLDIGAGTGRFCLDAASYAARVVGVEPEPAMRRYAEQLGCHMIADWNEFADESADLITLFHILEEFETPRDVLAALAKKLKPGGSIVISTPNVENVLITPLRLPEYVTFHLHPARRIYWSAHALAGTLEQAGLSAAIHPFQRYSLANHFNWLLRRCPGSLPELAEVLDDAVENAYRSALVRSGRTDMLWVIATRP